MNLDLLEECMLNSLYNENLEKEALKPETELIEVFVSLNEESNAKGSSSSKVKEQDVEKSYEGLILKELPKHLKYVFLEEERSKPVIIAAYLSIEKKWKVVEILIKHKEAIALSVEDLKGINPSICMHKILMEENASTSIEHHMRLNIVMKEMVKKEVLKWLNYGFIYAI